MSKKNSRALLSFFAFLGLTSALAEEVTLTPDKDNTLIESTTGALSNGSGQHFFAGRTNQVANSRRRAVLSFDLTSIPPQSVVNSVRLTLNMSRTRFPPPARSISVHRLLKNFGEGSSDAAADEGAGDLSAPGDATWIHNFFSTELWGNAGGDFEPAESASVNVIGTGFYSWESAQLVADVQAWVDDPGSNFGWLLKDQENSSQTSKRFDSRDHSNASVRPQLVVDFSPAQPPAGTIQFTASEFSVGEDAATATISLSRTAGSSGAVSVVVSTSDGSALSGQDYEALTQTVTFQDGQSDDQAVEILLLDDDRFEGDEFVFLTLSDPEGASIGIPSSALLTILENEELTERLNFAQFGNGDLLFSQITLQNTALEGEAFARIVIRDSQGAPLQLTLNGAPLEEGRFETIVPASGLRVLETDNMGTTVVGSVAVLSDRPLSGVILFGGAVGLAGVPSSEALSNGFSAPLEVNQSETIDTGIAVQNLEEETVTLDLELLDSEGALIATARITIPPLGQSAQFVSQIDWDPAVDFSNFRGSLRAVSDGTVAATVIQTRPQQFATLPVTPGTPQ